MDVIVIAFPRTTSTSLYAETCPEFSVASEKDNRTTTIAGNQYDFLIAQTPLGKLQVRLTI